MTWMEQRCIVAGGIGLALLVAASCKEAREEAPAQVPLEQVEPGQPPPLTMEPIATLTPAAVRPELRVVGESGIVPERLEVIFGRLLFAQEAIGSAPDKATVLTISPEVDGRLQISDRSRLTFVPTKSFALDTTYTVELEAVHAPGGVLAPQDDAAWSHTFRTPAFGLVRMSQSAYDGRFSLTLDLVFSAAVSAQEVKRRASVTVNNKLVLPYRVGQPATNVTRIWLRPTSGLEPGSTVRVKLAAGIPARNEPKITAPELTTTVVLEGGEPIEVQNVALRPGQTGFSVEVTCYDRAAGGERYVYDQQTGQQHTLSRRCVLSPESVKEAIHIEPPVAVRAAATQRGFRLMGEFQRGTHRLRIDAGARSIDNGVLRGAYTWTFTVPPRAPEVSFVAEGRYLPRSAFSTLAIRHVNVESATLTVRRIPDRNLVFWLGQPQETATPLVSDLLATHRIPLGGPADRAATTWVDVSRMVPDEPRGLLELTIASETSADRRRLLLTDLHLVAKRQTPDPAGPQQHAIHAWALDIDSNEAASGVEVSLVRPSGTTLAECRTAGESGCLLTAEQASDLTEPIALIARRGDDFTYIKFADLRADVTDTEVAGESYRSAHAYRAAIYSDRGVYRPGDTAHLVGILRDRDNRAPKGGMPVDARLIDPHDKELKRAHLETNAAGMVNLDVPFAQFAATGRYRLALTAAGKAIGEYDFQIEEFVPERMKVDVELDRRAYLPTDSVRAAIGARYLFGGVPADHEVELTCELRPAAFAPTNFANYRYGIWRAGPQAHKPIVLGQRRGTLDAKGNTEVDCAAAQGGARLEGPARIHASAAVFEAGSGRTTVGRASARVHPERYYVGLASGAKRVKAGKGFSVKGVVVDWDGEIVSHVKAVTVELHRLERELTYYYDEQMGESTSTVLTQPMLSQTKEVTVKGGQFSVRLTAAEDAAGFVIRALSGKAQSDLHLDGFGCYYARAPAESHVDRTPKPVAPSWLAIEGPSETRVGEATTVTLRAPYRGRILFTLETDEVLESEWRQVEGGRVAWTFEVAQFVPNVYVGAFLIKDPHLESKEAYLPDRAFGVRSIAVEPTEQLHAATITAPKEVRSNSRLTIEVRAQPGGGPAFATVAAVDEGILSLTQFATPDPAALLFARRALEVETFETVGWALSLPAGGPSSSTGGDEEEAEQAAPGRVQPIKPVALWSGIVPVVDGRARVTFDVPLYRGELRVMAVTASQDRVGSAEARVTVRDPLVVQSTLPRFLTYGDLMQVPVFVTNVSGKRRRIDVSIAAEMLPVPGLTVGLDEPSPISIKGLENKRLILEDGEAGTVVFQAKAIRPTGAAKLKVLAKSGDLVSRDEADVPLLPNGPKARLNKRIALVDKKTDLKPYLTGWMPMSESTTFWATANPYGEAFDHLKYLIRYPYG